MTRHIEQTDRGITLNKSLAWTMAVALVSAGIWVGAQLSSTQTALQGVRAELSSLRETVTALTPRVRANETGLARQDERLTLILSTLTRIDARLERMERAAPRRPQ